MSIHAGDRRRTLAHYKHVEKQAKRVKRERDWLGRIKRDHPFDPCFPPREPDAFDRMWDALCGPEPVSHPIAAWLLAAGLWAVIMLGIVGITG